MRSRSSSHLIAESFTTLKHRNRRRSKQRVEPFSLEETPVVRMADQRTMAELIRAPTEGYAEAIVVPPIPAEHFELKHSLDIREKDKKSSKIDKTEHEMEKHEKVKVNPTKSQQSKSKPTSKKY
ncbi:hypothetical protein Tco_0544141 [Tanacetum coccineum]